MSFKVTQYGMYLLQYHLISGWEVLELLHVWPSKDIIGSRFYLRYTEAQDSGPVIRPAELWGAQPNELQPMKRRVHRWQTPAWRTKHSMPGGVSVIMDNQATRSRPIYASWRDLLWSSPRALENVATPTLVYSVTVS